MTKISHTEPSKPCSIIHWTNMEEMKWLSGARLGVLAANKLGLSLDLAEIFQTFGQYMAAQRGHGMTKISHTEPSKCCNTILLRSC
jgi:hypothetical protein